LVTKVVTILVGPPCVGKSTYLKNIDYDFVISSDDVEDLLSSQAGIQYHEFFKLPMNSKVRKQHIKIFKHLIAESKNFTHVVWDLTNLTKKARKAIFKHYPGATFHAVVFNFLGHEASILERNKQRFKQLGKLIDERVIKSMLSSYEPVEAKEGFKNIKIIEFSNN
jgi:tRNA uridine 5-carbamoylmethylation protein Kti12